MNRVLAIRYTEVAVNGTCIFLNFKHFSSIGLKSMVHYGVEQIPSNVLLSLVDVG